MIDVFLSPMFDPRIRPFGIPLDALVIGLVLVASIVGQLWIRRLTHVEPEQRIFRATTRAEPTQIAMRIGVVAFAVIALVTVVATRA